MIMVQNINPVENGTLSCCKVSSKWQTKEDNDEDFSSKSSDENKERGNWSSKLEFLLSCLSFAVGLGNIWRFPYLCYRNGGGAFLIPYVLNILVTGLPIFFLELSLGQYASEGPISVWKICPLFQGVGYGMFMISVLVSIYYNVIIAWSFFYFFSSFTTYLPWASCDNWWNTEACRRFDNKNCTLQGGLLNPNGTCIFQGMVSVAEWDALNSTAQRMKMPADEYFHNYMLDISTGIHDLGDFKWTLASCLLLAWILVFLVLLKGIKSIGKVVYFTATLPYLILFIILIRVATMPGYIEGIKFYLTPHWEKLAEARVWADASIQIFFSLGLCWGGLITLSSYSRFHNNCYRDAIFITFGNCLTSFFAGFVIFGIIGFMAHELGVPADKVAAQGAGLAFIAYPEAVARLPVSPLWAVLFFFVLLTLGFGTQFTLVETVVTTIVDLWPAKLQGKNHKWVLLACCTCMFMLGLVMCTEGGLYILQLVDNYAATFSSLIIGMTEVLVVSWIYSTEHFLNDIRVMLGKFPFHYQYWRYIWKYIAPGMLLFILIFTLIDFQPTKYDDYVYPAWANHIGFVLSCTSVSMVPLIAAYKISQLDGPIMERVRRLLKPDETWGPALTTHQKEANMAKFKLIPSDMTLATDQMLYDNTEDTLPDVIHENEATEQLRTKLEITEHETGI